MGVQCNIRKCLPSLFIELDTIVEYQSFIYSGAEYEAQYYLVSDSVVDIKDDDVKQLLDDLYSLPNLVTYFHRNGIIEYFDNDSLFKAALPGIIEEESNMVPPVSFEFDVPDDAGNIPLPEVTDNCANLFIYDNDNYGGTMQPLHLSSNARERRIEHLKPIYGMNDKTTSIVAYSFGGTTQYQFYEDDTYRNHCLAFTTYANSREKINGPLDSHFINPSGFNYGMTFLPDLKNIHVIGTNSSSWNDRITSIIITRM